MQRLTISGLILVLAGCQGGGVEVTGYWNITAINATPVVDGTQAFLEFGDDLRLNGNSSCNNLFGTYRIDGATVIAGDLGSTRKMCAGPAMEQEEAVLAALGQPLEAAIESDVLVLSAGDSEVIRAVRGSR